MSDKTDVKGPKLLAIPQVDLDLLPLSLPLPNGINNGGYIVPSFSGRTLPRQQNMYSPIDLLVAGLYALHYDLIVTSLVNFFDQHRDGVFSEHEVFITYIPKGCSFFLVKDVAYLKHIVIHEKDKIFLKILKRNAPLTFKWVTV